MQTHDKPVDTRFQKLPAKANVIVFPLVLTFLMSGIVSLIATLRALGFQDGVLLKFVESWGASWAVAFPTVIFVLPLVRRLVGLVVQTPAGLPR
ncbi:MAG: DUF2798 domain-containing protein [Rhodospirillales bacterium]